MKEKSGKHHVSHLCDMHSQGREGGALSPAEGKKAAPHFVSLLFSSFFPPHFILLTHQNLSTKNVYIQSYSARTGTEVEQAAARENCVRVRLRSSSSSESSVTPHCWSASTLPSVGEGQTSHSTNKLIKSNKN